MSNAYTLIVEEHVEKLMGDPATAAAVLGELKAMNDGVYETHAVELFVTRRGRFTIADAYVHMICRAHWHFGAILEIGVQPGIKGGPKADKDRQGNQRILDTLPDPFRGKFYGEQTQGPDGWIEWSDTIVMEQHLISRTGEHSSRSIRVEPDGALLEAGSLSGYVMLQHLETGSPVARWPYDCDYLTLMIPSKCHEDSPFRLSLPGWRDDPDEDEDDLPVIKIQGRFDFP